VHGKVSRAFIHINWDGRLLKSEVYTICVNIVMYESKTWPVKVEVKVKLTEIK